MAGITTLTAVGAHVPGFRHGAPGGTSDDQIQTWINARWGEILTVLTRRALTVPLPTADGYSVLELVNRLGAASDLAAALAVKITGGQPWPPAKGLREDFLRMLQRLDDGEFDKMLTAAAQTADVGARIKGVAGQEMNREPDLSLNVAVHMNMKF